MAGEITEVPKATHMTEFFIKAVEGVVDQLCANPQAIRPYVYHLAGSLRLNELELVAWMFVLKKALYGEAQDRQLRALQYSAYLTKAAMCKSMDYYDIALRREDPHFPANYAQWLASHRRCAEISIRDLHTQFKEMWTRGKESGSRENLNVVVDSIVQAKTDLKTAELEIPQIQGSFEGMLTPNFPNAAPLSGSFFLEEMNQSSRLF